MCMQWCTVHAHSPVPAYARHSISLTSVFVFMLALGPALLLGLLGLALLVLVLLFGRVAVCSSSSSSSCWRHLRSLVTGAGRWRSWLQSRLQSGLRRWLRIWWLCCRLGLDHSRAGLAAGRLCSCPGMTWPEDMALRGTRDCLRHSLSCDWLPCILPWLHTARWQSSSRRRHWLRLQLSRWCIRLSIAVVALLRRLKDGLEQVHGALDDWGSIGRGLCGCCRLQG